MQIIAGHRYACRNTGVILKMPHTEVQKLVQSLDTFQEVRSVNALIQGICARSANSDLGGSETKGLAVVLSWQNEKMLAAEGMVQTVLKEKTARERAV
jgi:hypothetical protein